MVIVTPLAVQDIVLPTQLISASNGASTSPTTSTVSGLLQEWCVIRSVTTHLETTFVGKFLSPTSVSFSLLIRGLVGRHLDSGMDTVDFFLPFE